MKIAVTGKGGTGKTSLSAGIALIYQSLGKRVIAIDADPDANLGTALGFKDSERPLPVSGLKKVIIERTGEVGAFFKMNPRVDDIPDTYSAQKGGIRLLEMGTIKTGGSGCVCPESAFLKALLTHIFLNRDEVVVVDMEAGVEHLGRGTAEAADRFLIVVEPNRTSISTAKKIKKLAENLFVKDVKCIGNKIRNTEDKEFILRESGNTMKVIGFIRYDESLALCRGVVPKKSQFLKDLEEVLNGETNR